jgi:hypothetical protein
MMTDEQLQAIRERMENATNGEWVTGLSYLMATVNDGSNPYWIPYNIPHGECTWCKSYKLIGTKVSNGVNVHVHANVADFTSIVSPSALEVITTEESGLTEENAAFIANARQDIESLLAEVDRLRKLK